MLYRIRDRFRILILFGVVILTIYFERTTKTKTVKEMKGYIHEESKDYKEVHKNTVKSYYERRKNWKTSNLGTILFKNKPYGDFANGVINKTYVVLIWKYWDWLKQRHVDNFQSSQKKGPAEILDHCSVNNCVFSGDETFLNTADAIIIHMQKKIIPKVLKRNPEQRWIFLSDESPINTFSLAEGSYLGWSDMSDVFNWTMTYRSDSDVPVPYGRTIPLPNPVPIDTLDTFATLNTIVPYWKEKKYLNRTIILTSNCMQTRIKFIRGLQNHMKVDVFGKCSEELENKKKCPGHFREDCLLPAQYLFYLVLENSKCRQYITEKMFQHAYSKGAIPVIIGPYKEDCKNLLPPNSFLHFDNFKNIQELAEYMIEISKDLEKILSFHDWRRHFAIVNEHGYFKTRSYHLCRVCEALNYNDVRTKTYSANELQLFFNKNILCDSSNGLKQL